MERFLKSSSPLRKIFILQRNDLKNNFSLPIKNNPNYSSFSNKIKTIPSENKPKLTPIRLHSSVRIYTKKPTIIQEKIKRLHYRSDGFNWNKWQHTNKKILHHDFFNNIKNKVKKHNKLKIQEEYRTQQLKLKHELRDLKKIKENICKAKIHSQLIQKLTEESQNIINNYFQQMEKQIKNKL